jgi:hypothetical protein
MIISHRHRFIFLKTRKTASTSIELALFGHLGPDDIVTPLTRSGLTERAGHRPRHHIRPIFALDPRPQLSRVIPLEGLKWIDYHDHIRAGQVQGYVGVDVWRKYYKFAFERNVYDRQVSWFHYRTRKLRKKKRWPTFESFLGCPSEAKVDNFEIYSIDGEPAVDFLGRFERLEGDLDRVFSAVGLPGRAVLPRAKTGVRSHASDYRAYYTEETRRLVESWYPGEIRLFGYEF